MTHPRPPEVLIHVLAGAGSGRTTFVRRFIYNTFDNSYDPTCLVGPYRNLVDVEGTTVVVGLETSQASFYSHDSEVDRMIGPADALILIMAPGRPAAMDETVRLRFEVLNKVIESKERFMERVVIMKDIDVPWDTCVPGNTHPENMLDDIDDVERGRREREWEKGAEKGYELGRKLGAEVTVACPRTGEGVKEVIHELVLNILEERRAAAEEARRLEEDARREEEERLKAAEKCAKSFTSRLKGFIGASTKEGRPGGS